MVCCLLCFASFSDLIYSSRKMRSFPWLLKRSFLSELYPCTHSDQLCCTRNTSRYWCKHSNRGQPVLFEQPGHRSIQPGALFTKQSLSLRPKYMSLAMLLQDRPATHISVAKNSNAFEKGSQFVQPSNKVKKVQIEEGFQIMARKRVQNIAPALFVVPIAIRIKNKE